MPAPSCSQAAAARRSPSVRDMSNARRKPASRGVAVYSAHRDTHFAFLKNIVIGDDIDVTRHDGRTFRYRVDATSVVRFDASGIDPLSDGHELVLSTCWPFDALTQGPERYLVHATMLGDAPASR